MMSRRADCALDVHRIFRVLLVVCCCLYSNIIYSTFTTIIMNKIQSNCLIMNEYICQNRKRNWTEKMRLIIKHDSNFFLFFPQIIFVITILTPPLYILIFVSDFSSNRNILGSIQTCFTIILLWPLFLYNGKILSVLYTSFLLMGFLCPSFPRQTSFLKWEYTVCPVHAIFINGIFVSVLATVMNEARVIPILFFLCWHKYIYVYLLIVK